MAWFEKDVLYPGTYHLGDGRVVTYTRDDVVHMAQRTKDMVAAGLAIPVCWEHQDDAVPLSAAELRARRARFNLGFLAKGRVSPGGFLEAVLDVPLADDAQRLPAVRFISPEIRRDWIDGSGRLWPGLSITHLAATARPVQHKQQPFRPVPATQLSLARLSLAAYLGDRTMANSTTELRPPQLKTLLRYLREVGLHLPDDTDMDNLLERLLVAAMTKVGALEDEQDIREPDEPGGGLGYPIAMSIDYERGEEEIAAAVSGLARMFEQAPRLFATPQSQRVAQLLQSYVHTDDEEERRQIADQIESLWLEGSDKESWKAEWARLKGRRGRQAAGELAASMSLEAKERYLGRLQHRLARHASGAALHDTSAHRRAEEQAGDELVRIIKARRPRR